MREGGFLVRGNNRYLREMRTHLQMMLGQDAVLRPVPVTRPFMLTSLVEDFPVRIKRA